MGGRSSNAKSCEASLEGVFEEQGITHFVASASGSKHTSGVSMPVSNVLSRRPGYVAQCRGKITGVARDNCYCAL